MQQDTSAQPSVSRASLPGSGNAPAINRWAIFSCPLSRTAQKGLLGQSFPRARDREVALILLGHRHIKQQLIIGQVLAGL